MELIPCRKPIIARKVRAICPRLSWRLFRVTDASYNAVIAGLPGACIGQADFL
ncbi:MAG: hypothetical protein WAW61_03170 [Methylococcaceae bacterium]